MGLLPSVMDLLVSAETFEHLSEAVFPTLSSLIALRYQAGGLLFSRKRRTSSHLVGGSRATVRGRGMDFAKVREYQPGDEVRHMDWRVTARTNKPHVKIYQEERERPIFVLLDCRSNMFFGTRQCFKSVIAAQAAAIIAWEAVEHGDRIGGLIFNEQQQVELKPRARRHGALHLLNQIVALAPREANSTEPTSLVPALRALSKISRPGSLLFIISDFYGYDSEMRQELQRLVPHREVISTFVYDPLEAEPPDSGSYQFSDGSDVLNFDATQKKLCLEYRKQFQQKRAALKALHLQYGMGWLELPTNSSVLDRLRYGLHQQGELKT